jgi:predicted GNAT family N-acyltransferase
MKVRVAVPSDREAIRAIRHEVFVVGQGVPEAIEQDGRDDEALHVLAELDGVPVGTARMRVVDGVGKAERVAVLAAARGQHAGLAMMRQLEAEAARRQLPRVVLHAQASVIAWYAAQGYTGEGDRFVEAGIEHLTMWKAV